MEAHMTKKHFIELANHIKDLTLLPQPFDVKPFTQSQIEYLADFCAAQNPRFNRSRWLGYIAGENGKNGGKVKQAA
jgi:hypothetical protein